MSNVITNGNELLRQRFMDARQIGHGMLQLSVHDINVGMPVQDAVIFVSKINDDGTKTQVEELRSDISGQTLMLELDAPPKEYSMSPDLPRPYSEYSARVTAKGFEPMDINGIQIFPETLALQNFNLAPASSSAMRQEEIVLIKPHTLWGEYPAKIPEAAEKPLPPSSGFVVLDKPVIPEFIVVHDGSPSSTTAPNYYIPFKDYIKNVASSEIYATWPDAAIRANIMAIISFTLNRVFTEWYRNKNKNFTITSSTAYDHAFFYGRNIYQEISRIVDEMFATYITKPGIRQPLLAQYCDGRKVKCPGWMT